MSTTARPRTVIYTAQFGDFDPIMPVLAPDPDVDYLVLSDRRLRVPAPWRLERVTVPVQGLGERMKNRWCKLHATDLFPDHDVSVYVDAHLQIVGDLRPLVDGFLRSESAVGVVPHPKSTSIAHEVERSLRSGRISPAEHRDRWPQQRERHRAEGFTDGLGVFAGGVVLRSHQSPRAVALEAVWWEDLVQGVTRDQVALSFALWRTGTEPYRIPLGWTFAPYFRHWGHLQGTRRHARLVRWFAARRPVRPWFRWPVRLLTPRATLRAVAARLRLGRGRVPVE